MSERLAGRGARGRRSTRIRRASAGLTPVRAGALLAMLASAAAIYGAASSPAFGLVHLELEGVRYSDESAVRTRLAVPAGVNLFTLATDPLEARLRELPTVAAARVTVRLPDSLSVSLIEREPVMIWQVGERRLLAGADGVLFARLGEVPPPGAADLPVVDDRRAAAISLGVGWRLDPVDFDAATRLAAVRPVDVGSVAPAVSVSVTDDMGYVMTTGEGGWTAVFGFYTPSLRTPELIPGQVRLLRSLLDGREATVERVILASETDGTYIPRATPAP
ncbi:MAG TPA: FtsQ-type POTRA domain-containing protein [Candidatus Limnocylindrales bacterium]|nr:FtsQ-type POTRA domain-containing protein [Candidatus Limnocylindrales bacterium]